MAIGAMLSKLVSIHPSVSYPNVQVKSFRLSSVIVTVRTVRIMLQIVDLRRLLATQPGTNITYNNPKPKRPMRSSLVPSFMRSRHNISAGARDSKISVRIAKAPLVSKRRPTWDMHVPVAM